MNISGSEICIEWQFYWISTGVRGRKPKYEENLPFEPEGPQGQRLFVYPPASYPTSATTRAPGVSCTPPLRRSLSFDREKESWERELRESWEILCPPICVCFDSRKNMNVYIDKSMVSFKVLTNTHHIPTSLLVRHFDVHGFQIDKTDIQGENKMITFMIW